MINKLIKFCRDSWIGIVAFVVALAYAFGLRKGKQNEKMHNDKKVLANISRADRARTALNDSDVVRRLRKKYTRK